MVPFFGVGNAQPYGRATVFLNFFLVFLKFACVLFAFEVKVKRILAPNGGKNSCETNAMTPSNSLAFVYHPLVAGTFGGLMNIAYTVIVFTLDLSALCVGGWVGRKPGDG